MSNQITPNPEVPSQVIQEVTFPKFVNNLGIIPTSYKDSMSYYETLAWLCKYLEETVIPSVNQNGDAVEELQGLYIELNSYVAHYFDNLDVQEEINNKLDEMATDGSLYEIIRTYTDPIVSAQNARLSALETTVAGIESTNPIFVSSTSQMTDHAQIYVLVSSGNIYYYNGTQFVDSGVTYGITNDVFKGVPTNVSSTDDLDDFNNAVPNRCYLINTDDIPNQPEAHTGTLLTFHKQTSISGGYFQIFIPNAGTNLYFRNRWGTQYHEWQHIKRANTTFSSYETAIGDSSVISDFNSVEANSCYIINVTNLANMPVAKKGTLLTYNRQSSVSGGYCQIYITLDNEIYHRMRWLDFSNWVKILSNNDTALYPLSDISMFTTLGVIGDSWASGYTYPNNVGTNNYQISWPQVLGRKHGINVTNFSEGGLTTKTWLSDNDHGLDFLNSESAKQLYMIALGINDATAIDNETMDLGTIEDIDTLDSSNNADSFYGNYGKIVSAILTKNANAKIILLTIPRTDKTTYATLNTAMSEIATLFNIPIITSLDDPLFSSSFFLNTKVNAHPVAGSYAGMAEAYSRLFNDCIINNATYFRNYYGS